MSPDQADSHATYAGAYVHIPFCSAICPYCDFAVVAGKDHLARRYVDALVGEIRHSEHWRRLDAVYFGGGTPSHLDPTMLGEVLAALSACHGLAHDAEISLEANPEDFDVAKAERFAHLGFNRVSFGAQSLDRGVLASLGRRHHPGQVGSAVEAARAAGIENVSVDLIFGTPEETHDSWRSTLESAIALQTQHVSCYALTVEPGTPLSRQVGLGAPAPDPDMQADRYLAADAMLSAAGLARYEVSNWASAGRECRYNMIVWAQGEYLGYGASAQGHRAGRRYRNVRRLETYLERVERGESPVAGQERIVGWDAEIDRVFVGLRRAVGVAEGIGTQVFLDSDEGRLLASAGVVAVSEGRLRIERPLLTDEVHRSVVSQMPPIVSG